MAKPQKRLCMFFDGTWNEPEMPGTVTSVINLMRSVPVRDDSGTPQLVFYDAGVGSEGSKVTRMVAGASGLGLAENIRDGYRILSNNYEEGDEIYIFGFSRGAYTARSLAGMIGLLGLAHPEDLEHVMAGWEIYRLPKAHAVQRRERAQAFRKGTGKGRKAPAWDVKTRCVDVWDTVGALGVPSALLGFLNRSKYDFHDTQLGQSVDIALHAVSIDDRRAQFLPTLWESPTGKAPDGVHAEQVWFPGGHSGVCGGYISETEEPIAGLGLPHIALDWMMKRVTALTDLHLITPSDLMPDPSDGYFDKIKFPYWFSHALPALRLIGGEPVKASGLRSFLKGNLGDLHTLKPQEAGNQFVNECIHRSALERLDLHRNGHRSDRFKGYDAPNLEAALKSGGLPIVGWDGEIEPS